MPVKIPLRMKIVHEKKLLCIFIILSVLI